MKDPIITSIFDEVTNYSKHDESKDAAKDFSSRAVSDPRKAAEGIIMIAHAFPMQRQEEARAMQTLELATVSASINFYKQNDPYL
jgi:hypothetical protein